MSFIRQCYGVKKAHSCSKSDAGLLPYSHQVDIRMRSHRLLRLHDNKSAASCHAKVLMKVDCQDVLFTSFMQCKLFQQHVASLYLSNFVKSDFTTDLIQLDDKLTRPVKSTTGALGSMISNEMSIMQGSKFKFSCTIQPE